VISGLTKPRNFTEREVGNLIATDLEVTLRLLLSECEALLARRGIQSAPATPSALQAFHNLSPHRQTLILNELQNGFTSLNEVVESPFGAKVNRDRELRLLSRYLNRLGLKVARSEIMDLIDEEDVLEIYTLGGIQIFRSWSCFRVCSYSLADLLIYDWQTLYDRPSAVVTHIHECLKLATSSEKPIVKYAMPEYIMTERFDGHDNVFYFKMKYLVAVLDEQTNQVTGLLSTGAVQLASAPKQTMKISCI
jgi:hypothetical protein